MSSIFRAFCGSPKSAHMIVLLGLAVYEIVYQKNIPKSLSADKNIIYVNYADKNIIYVPKRWQKYHLC